MVSVIAPLASPFKNLPVLWRTFKSYRWKICTLIGLGILSAALDGVGINAIIPLVSFYVNAGSPPADLISQTLQGFFSFFHVPFSFRYLLAFIIGLFLLRAVTMTISGYIRGWISADFVGRESESMLRRMLRASWPFLLKQKIGTLQATLVRDIQQTENLLQVFGQIIQSFTGASIYLLIALNISPTITLYTIIAGAVLLFVVRPFLARSQAIANVFIAAEKGYTHFLSEHIVGAKAVKAAGAEESALQKGSGLLMKLRALSIRGALIRSMSNSLFQPFVLIFVIVLFAFSYQQPDFNMISFAATLYLIQKIFTYLESGHGALHSVRETLPYVQNIEAFKRLLDEHRESSTAGTAPVSFARDLVFQNVSFSYGEKKPVLHAVNLILRRGETVGLIGPSGAGKTSIADILLRLFRPTEGRLLVDGVPAEDMDMAAWRRQIGYVAQDVFLFNGTIEENIRFYRPELSAGDIEEAAKRANIYDFIVELPEGFETITGDRGVMLSGGQRQRIALARALVGNPSLLILDEATSALDSASEKLIQESIRALRGRVTVLIIAHRLTTVEYADRILVLDRGNIIEEGSPAELLARPNSYFATHHTRRT